jgi:hypothetical protein
MMPVTTATPDDNNPCTTYGGILIGDAGVDGGPAASPPGPATLDRAV